jgi:hypothetical protein
VKAGRSLVSTLFGVWFVFARKGSMASMHERTGVCLIERAAIALAVAVLLHFALIPPAWAGTDDAKSSRAKHATVPAPKEKAADNLDASSSVSVPKDSSAICVGTTVQTPSDNSADVAAPDSENQSTSETMKYRLRLSGDRNQDSASESALVCERPKMTDRPKTSKCDPSNPDEANSPDCKPSLGTSPK